MSPSECNNVQFLQEYRSDNMYISQYDKEAEFRTWLVEERKINPETISKELTKKEFAKFIEDFNTG